jgi:hypothetical protein
LGKALRRGNLKKAAAVLLVALAAPAFAVSKGKAVYMGGTLSVKAKTELTANLLLPDTAVLQPKANEGSPVIIPWASVLEAEYGQKAGRRIKTAIFLSPLALFGKSRQHYVTISWKDATETEQAAVLEFDKDDIRQVLAVIKTRTGKQIVYQDEEAQKQMGGGAVK